MLGVFVGVESGPSSKVRATLPVDSGGGVVPVEGGGLAALLTPWLSRSKESAKTIAVSTVSTVVDVLYVRNRANLLLELIPIHPSL